MPVVFQKWITRADLRANPDKVYVFGDNVERVGFGGQAKEMRGEPNAIGVATKWKPTNEDDAFFSDTVACYLMIGMDLGRVEDALRAGKTVVIPEDGLGTGLSQLPTKAPELNSSLQEAIAMLAAEYSAN